MNLLQQGIIAFERTPASYDIIDLRSQTSLLAHDYILEHYGNAIEFTHTHGIHYKPVAWISEQHRAVKGSIQTFGIAFF